MNRTRRHAMAATAATAPTADRRDKQYFRIEIWRGFELVEVVAVSYRRPIAMAAYHAACRLRLTPGLSVVLRQGFTTLMREAVNDNDERSR
ncbi:MAG: hypothetical protein CTY25_12045 [Methylobacterium sp.]|nr:MAG: hypothetical protein CTY25_12045 [Methylobacterium sp.]